MRTEPGPPTRVLNGYHGDIAETAGLPPRMLHWEEG